MTFLKKPDKSGLPAVFVTVAAIWCLALVGIANAQVTLGDAVDFAVLSDAGPLTLGNSTVISGVSTNVGATYGNIKMFGNNTKVNGDAIATLFELGPGATISLLNHAHVLGACVTDGGAITLAVGATCLSQDTTGTSPDLTMIGNAVNQEEVFDQAVLCQTPTQSLAAINLAASKTKTITDTVPNGLNVISTPSITLGNSSEPAGFNPPAITPSVFLNNSSVVFGSVHGGYTCGLGSGVTINGAIICDFGFTAGPNLRVHFAPATGLSLSACAT